MSYFEKFPKIYYDANADGKYKVMTDIISRVKLVDSVKQNILNFDYYNVKDGETPEMIAHKYYDDPELHWTILIVNDVIDYYTQWPMSVQKFEEFMKDKYTNPQGIHHYEISQTSGNTELVIDVGMNTTDYPSATAISNYTYEDRLQEQRRQIRLIQPQYMGGFVKEFEKKLNESI
tara:strand:- start:1275 stop:1802 length:528 start_codon:yes stop_codon:yes gene_type:complete